ncbi:hypothetical protein GQ568_02940 [Patescibacteria group bacterium]|nr:hypothetical protein [Patescibacteria group bacterium]
MAKKNIEIKSLTKKDIEELSKRKERRGVSFSLYLGIKARRNFVSEANSVITNTVKKIEAGDNYSKSEKKKIKEISDEIKNEIKFLKLPDETKSIIIFFDTRRTRKAYHIPVYIPSRFVIESNSYIHPLVKALEKYPRYMVVVLERNKARFFSIFLNEIEQMSEIIQSDVPQRINAARAEWKGLRENKIRGHIEDHIQRHLKKVSKETADYFRKDKFNYLIVGIHKELKEKFAETLSARSRKKLIGSYHIVSGYNLNRIKAKSGEVINKREKQAEAETIKNLFNRFNKEKRSATIEINSVLENFYLHNIDTLVIGKDYKEAGYVCPECHYISSYIRSCPKCKSKMTKAGDIADEIIEEAVLNKIKIKHLLYSHREFDEFGIGAFLKSAI